MRARKKMGTIEVNEYVGPTQIPLPPDVVVRPNGTAFVANALHQSEINIQPGDYIRVDVPGDRYPIDRAYFEANYEAIPTEIA